MLILSLNALKKLGLLKKLANISLKGFLKGDLAVKGV